MSREFCRDVPDPWVCSKSLCLKSSCAFFVPYQGVFPWCSVAIQIALYRPPIGPPARNGKKNMAEKWMLAPPGKRGEKWPKNGFWPHWEKAGKKGRKMGFSLNFIFDGGCTCEKKSAFTKAASIPARRQSENAGPRLFGFIFRCCPPSRIFFAMYLSSALKRHLLKRHLTLSNVSSVCTGQSGLQM